MENGGVELIGLMQLDNRGLQERLIRAIFGPAIVPFVHVGVMECVAGGFELVPLNPGMEDIQNVVKDFVEREFWLWPCFGSFQMGINVSVKAISQKEFPYSGCWYRIDQNVVLGQCRMSFQPCFNRLHRRLTECNAFLVDFVAELDDRMKPLPGHPLGPLQHSL